MCFNTVSKLFAGSLGNFFRHLRLHHVAGTFCNQCINGDTVDHIQRIKHVSFGFTHLLTFFIADQTGYIYGLERNLTVAVFILHKVHGHHDHAGNPEEYNIKTCYQNIGRVVGFQLRSFIRPAEGGESPQA